MQWSSLTGKDYNAISANRPGFGNSTSAVPVGLYQFELGANMITKTNIDSTLNIPIVLRMGVYKNTEVQVGYTRNFLTLGVLYGGISIINRLENSIMLTSSFPIPLKGISYTDNNDSLIEYSAYLPISYAFGNGFSITGQIAGKVINNDITDPIYSYMIAIGSPLSKKTSWFFEAYQSHSNTDQHIPFKVDYGIIYLFANNVQFDLSMGMTFQREDSHYTETERFIDGGISFRLMK